jgi:MoaA/NifB/PqqE/SkfB family radical SAM enzyme
MPMRTTDILRAWKSILVGRAPSLSIEITRECPLRCPGCYAYDDNHLGGGLTLRQLRDFKGDDLIRGVLDVVDRHKPLHLSLVGGDPLVRYRELDVLVPQLLSRGVHVQVVTSAFRRLNDSWKGLDHFTVVVSIDGLAPEHDMRRKPATYDRILASVDGHRIIVHCTITSQMLAREGYLDEFLRFWSPREEVTKVWFSLFTPQRGATDPEILTKDQRRRVADELLALRRRYPKLDMPAGMIAHIPQGIESPDTCIFAQTTHTLSADLKTAITPCQYGGDPDCAQCGCIASLGLAAIGTHRLGGLISVGAIFRGSLKIGARVAARGARPDIQRAPENALRVLE